MTDADDRLSGDDARILAIESTSLTGHTLKLMVLRPGAPVDLEALRASISARLDRHPRARERVDVDTQGGPRWIAADHFDIGDHVRRRAGTECATSEDLRRTVSVLMSEHLDRSKPLWTLDLIGPLADGSEAIAARMHHAMVDGIAGMRFLDALLLDPHDAQPVTASAGRSPADAPRSVLSEVTRLPQTIGRELGHPGSRSPFDRPITGARDVAFAVVPLEGLKAIGASRPRRATVNDVLLAVVSGGLRSWLGDIAAHLDLRAQVPVSLHHRDEDATSAGNRDSFMNVDLQLDVDDPLERLDRISALTRTEKQAGDAALLYDLFHALGAVPGVDALAHRISDSSREFSVAISNVPGPRSPVAVAGRRVDRLFSSSEPGAHHALRIAAISHAGDIGIGFCTDPTAITGIETLADSVAKAYDALRRAALDHS
ncbi:wax ester/triacylglycerol synthase domain-containing protein [Microbacterium sp. SLBN-146]|uniref:wax ester/triacylglycerol synthase domain-containing protein n=1 Tax=Microbacterium sp. SLBN-146 TaxID=2768457 RepID=UPI00114F9CF5|nr:wax ester/triacylglycerol synthase domain-containing protein [Microbacterium sp. SLBN-146]TQJ32409.1 WS/DGAT/MGAT family acyltransferase [Microbacterium sp. SLBN-146]